MADLSNKVISSNFQKLLQVSESNAVADATGSVTALSLDKANSRVGVGTNTPTKTLDVVGTINISGSEYFATSGSLADEIVSIVSSGSILPATPAGDEVGTYDLGSATHPWRDLYIYSGSLKLVSEQGHVDLNWDDVNDLRAGKLPTRRIDGTKLTGYFDARYIRGLQVATSLAGVTTETVDTDTLLDFSIANRIQIKAGGETFFDARQGEKYLYIGVDTGSDYHTTIKSITSASRDLYVGGNLKVDGNTVIDGNLTFGNADTDTIGFNADINTNLTPDSSSTYDLGSKEKIWSNIFVNTISASGDLYLDGKDIFTNQTRRITLDDTTVFYGDISSSGIITAKTGSFDHITTDTTNITVTNYSASKFTGSILASGSTEGYPATIGAIGDISASGRIYIAGKDVPKMNSMNTFGIAYASDGVNQLSSGTGLKWNYSTTPDVLEVVGDISASGTIYTTGNISASGDLFVEGNITSSGNISGSKVYASENLQAVDHLILGLGGGGDRQGSNVAYIGDTDNDWAPFVKFFGGIAAGEQGLLFYTSSATNQAASILWRSGVQAGGNGVTADHAIEMRVGNPRANGDADKTPNFQLDYQKLKLSGSGDTQLDVDGNITASAVTVSGDIHSMGVISSSTGISSSGNITLTAESSPQLKITDTSNDFALVIRQDNMDAVIEFNDNASQDLVFKSNATNNHLVLDSGTGNTGIGGTSTPSKTLTVQGDISASGDMNVAGNITASNYTGTISTAAQPNITSLGTLSSLLVSGNISGSTTGTGSFGRVEADSFNISSVDSLDITGTITAGKVSGSAVSTGSFGHGYIINNLGIGTISPGKELEVVGDISASGIITAEHFHSTDDAKITDDLEVQGNYSGSSASTFTIGGNATIGGNIDLEGDIDIDGISNLDNTDIDGTLNVDGNVTLGNEVKDTHTITGKSSFVGNITASGNISSSGGTIYASAGDFGYGDISKVGTIDVVHVRGYSDEDTHIRFGGDKITFTVGNEALLTLSQSSHDEVIVGDGGDVDFNVKTNGDNNTLFVEGSSDKVGIGTKTPGEKLTVQGNISASGLIMTTTGISSSGNIVIDNTKGLAFRKADGSTGDVNLTIDNNDVLRLGDTNLSHETFLYGQNQYLTISGSGIGIGNNEPQNTLDVFGNINTSGSNGHITASGNISASGTIYADNFQSTGGDVAGISFTDDLSITGNVTASGNISASGDVSASNFLVPTDGLIANSNNSDQNIKFESTSELEINSSTITLDASTINIDSSTGDIKFKDQGTEQFRLDMDGTAGAQVLQTKVAGDDLIFKSQGGDSLITLKSEGQTEIHGNITASGNISASGNIFGVSASFDGGVGIGNSSPTKQLVVEGDISASGILYINDTSAKVAIGDNVAGSLDGIVVTGQISASNNVTIKANSDHSNLIIDVNETNKDGRIEFKSKGLSNYWFINDTSAQNFRLYDDIHNENILTVTSSNVGIGTNITPSKKLTVEGDISASGGIYLNTNGIYQQDLLFPVNVARTISIGDPSAGNVDGAKLTIEAADANTEAAGNQDGGDIQLNPGGKVGSGTDGMVKVAGNISSSGDLHIQGNITASAGTGSFKFARVDSGEIYANSDFDFNQKVSASKELYVGSGTSGDAVLTLESDLANDDETANPYIKFQQDGGQVAALIGMVGNAGKNPQNSAFAGNHQYFGAPTNYSSPPNALMITTTTMGSVANQSGNNGNLILGTNNTGSVYINSRTQNVTIGQSNLYDSADQTGSAGTMLTVKGDLRVSGSAYVLADSLYVGDTAINETLVQNVKRGYSSTALSPAGLTTFVGKLSASGDIHAGGHISASGDLIVLGNDIKGSTLGQITTRLTLGATNIFTGNISSSGDIITQGHINSVNITGSNISASGKIYSDDEIHLRDGGQAGDTLIKQYASGDDGIIDVYQNNSVVNRIHGNGISYFNSNAIGIGTTTPDSDLEINPISSSNNTTASLHVSGAFSNIRLENLPVTKPLVTGSLWLSGSAGADSKFLVVFTG